MTHAGWAISSLLYFSSLLYLFFGAIIADVANDEAKAVGAGLPFGSLFIIAAIWPVMLAARIVYRFVRKF